MQREQMRLTDHAGLTGAIEREKLPPAGVEGIEGGVAPPNRTPCPILVRMFPSISAKKLLCCSLRRATLALLPQTPETKRVATIHEK